MSGTAAPLQLSAIVAGIQHDTGASLLGWQSSGVVRYLLRVTYGNSRWTRLARYSDFRALHEQLMPELPHRLYFPPKRMPWEGVDMELLASQRSDQFNSYLTTIIAMVNAHQSPLKES